jgi:hypothetical protein
MIRNSLRLSVLAAATLAVAHSAALAQTPSYANPPLQQPTYSASVNFTPAVTASKDIFTIIGSATKTVRVTRLQCSGTSTAAASIPVLLNKYTVATTGGTATTGVAVAADSSDGAATAVVKAYTAAPTVGTGGGPVRAGTLQTNLPAGNAAVPTTWDFSGRIPERLGMILRGPAQELALTVNTTALSAGTVLSCDVEWTEQ